MKDHLHELSGNIRVLAKTVLEVVLPPPPVAGIRVTILYRALVTSYINNYFKLKFHQFRH